MVSKVLAHNACYFYFCFVSSILGNNWSITRSHPTDSLRCVASECNALFSSVQKLSHHLTDTHGATNVHWSLNHMLPANIATKTDALTDCHDSTLHADTGGQQAHNVTALLADTGPAPGPIRHLRSHFKAHPYKMSNTTVVPETPSEHPTVSECLSLLFVPQLRCL